jgi:monovalent cation/proton antiporter MnhG/PhaG subunit
MTHLIAIVLLVLAVLMTAWCTVGFLRARDSLVRFHYLTPISTVATFALVLAIIIDGTSASMAIKAGITLAITALTSPVAQHAITRAIWVRRAGRWTLPDEGAR